jgi:hypothetical protein
MSYKVLPESLGNVPLLRLNNPQTFEGRICLQLQVERGKEELLVVGPCLLNLNGGLYIQVLHDYDVISPSDSFKFELSLLWAANVDDPLRIVFSKEIRGSKFGKNACWGTPLITEPSVLLFCLKGQRTKYTSEIGRPYLANNWN